MCRYSSGPTMDLGQVREATTDQAFCTLELELRVKIRKQNIDIPAVEGASESARASRGERSAQPRAGRQARVDEGNRTDKRRKPDEHPFIQGSPSWLSRGCDRRSHPDYVLDVSRRLLADLDTPAALRAASRSANGSTRTMRPSLNPRQHRPSPCVMSAPLPTPVPGGSSRNQPLTVAPRSITSLDLASKAAAEALVQAPTTTARWPRDPCSSSLRGRSGSAIHSISGLKHRGRCFEVAAVEGRESLADHPLRVLL